MYIKILLGQRTENYNHIYTNILKKTNLKLINIFKYIILKYDFVNNLVDIYGQKIGKSYSKETITIKIIIYIFLKTSAKFGINRLIISRLIIRINQTDGHS